VFFFFMGWDCITRVRLYIRMRGDVCRVNTKSVELLRVENGNDVNTNRKSGR